MLCCAQVTPLSRSAPEPASDWFGGEMFEAEQPMPARLDLHAAIEQTITRLISELQELNQEIDLATTQAMGRRVALRIASMLKCGSAAMARIRKTWYAAKWSTI